MFNKFEIEILQKYLDMVEESNFEFDFEIEVNNFLITEDDDELVIIEIDMGDNSEIITLTI